MTSLAHNAEQGLTVYKPKGCKHQEAPTLTAKLYSEYSSVDN